MLVETTACKSWRVFLRHSVYNGLVQLFYFYTGIGTEMSLSAQTAC